MPTSDYLPNTADVAAKIPTRTADNVGNFKNDFDTDTFPTAVQVMQLIETSERELAPKIGENLPDDELVDSAKDLLSIRTAMWVELTYFPRSLRSGESPYPELKVLFDENLASLITEIQEAGGAVDEDTGEAMGPTMRPAGRFPDPDESIGLETLW